MQKYICALICAALGFSAETAKADCHLDSELIELDLEDLPNAKPCTYTGRAFLIGLGHNKIPDSVESSDSEELQYYFLARTYLWFTRRNLNADFEDKFGFALSALALSNHVNKERRQIYETFFLLEYWRENEDGMESSGRPISEILIRRLRDLGLTERRQLDCFIEADIASLDIKAIKNSKFYRGCLGRYKVD